MDRAELVRLLTLWFAALAFLQTIDGRTGAVATIASWIAIGVVNLVPLFLLGEVAERSGMSIWPDDDRIDADRTDTDITDDRTDDADD